MSAGWKKVGKKARRSKHKRGKPHSGHRKAQAHGPGSDKRRQKVARRRRLEQLRTPEIDW